MKYFPLLFCLMLNFAFTVSAQTDKTSDCPKIETIVSDGYAKPGKIFTFTAKVENYDLTKLSFKWFISSGEILEGQETLSIKVKVNEKGETPVVVIEITGLPEGCPNTEYETGAVCGCHTPMLFDEFGSLPNGDLKARIQNLYVELSNNPVAQGYIISYGTDREIVWREKQLRDVISSLNLDASRVTLVRGGANRGKKNVWTKVWIVPPGAENPTPDM